MSDMGGGGLDPRVSRLADAVALAMGVERPAVFAEVRGGRLTPPWRKPRQVLAYLCAADLGLSYRQIAEALGYVSHGTLSHSVHAFAAYHGLPQIPARPFMTGKRLDWGDVAPTGPKTRPPAKARPEPVKVVTAPRRVPAAPRAARVADAAPSLPIAAPPARSKPGKVSALVAPVSFSTRASATDMAPLAERALEFLVGRDSATSQTLASCLDAKEMTVVQVLVGLRHEGLVEEIDAPEGAGRAKAWRLAVGE